MGALTNTFDDAVFIGELSLSGELRPINGVLPMAIEAKILALSVYSFHSTMPQRVLLLME